MQPTMADDPPKTMAAIQSSMDLPAGDPGERQRRLAAERERTTSKIMALLSRKPLRRALFRWILAWAQETASIREDVFFYALQGWPIARRTICEMGRRFSEAGSLSSPEDVFFLTWEEAQQGMSHGRHEDWRAVIAERRNEFRSRTLLAPPYWVPEGGPPLTVQRRLKLKVKRIAFGRKRTQEGTLRGVAASPGIATGPARIIRSTADFGLLKAGEILVAPSATPEWVPTFAIAAALVTDSGGPLSHSSIIVREFGIPAVMGAENATILIEDGQMITVDGGQGLIHIH
jgi:pyruvate,water dikinase